MNEDLDICNERSVQLINATGKNLREFKVLRSTNETDEEYERSVSLFNKLLDVTGY